MSAYSSNAIVNTKHAFTYPNMSLFLYALLCCNGDI